MTLAPPEQGMLPSPCVGICRLDDATGWCLGCARDTNELASWRELRRLGEEIRGSARICRGDAPGPFPCGRAHLFAVDGDTRITSVKPTPQMVQRR